MVISEQPVVSGYQMSLTQVPEKMSYYGTLTSEEKARMHPCMIAKCVMRSGDSPPPMQASIPSAYDVPDDAGLNGRVTTSSSSPTVTSIKPLRSDSGESDAEVISIEEAVPIVHKTLPTPEPQPKIEKNGYDRKYADEKKFVNDFDDDPCIVKCLYFTQQCCECSIM